MNNAWLLAAALAFSLTLWLTVGYYSPLGFTLLGVALICTALAMIEPDTRLCVISGKPGWLRYVFVAVLIAFFLLGVVRNRSRRANAEPIIDVLIVQRDGVQALLHGIDPYVISHADPYGIGPHYYTKEFASNGRLYIGYPYPPLSLLWVVPAYLLGDVRDAHLLAVELAALLVFGMGENVASFLAGLLLLAGPRTPTVLINSYIEPVMVLTLALTVYCAMRSPRWLPVALGLFFASKQYTFLAVPVVPFLLSDHSWKKSVKLLLQAASVAAAITLPFALWNLSAFWRDVVRYPTSQTLRLDALSYSALLFRLGVGQVPPLALAAATASALVLVLRYAPRTPGGFACAVAFLTAVFFAFSKQAFLNYYFFVTAAQCVAFAALNDGGSCTNKAGVGVPLSEAHSAA